MMFFLRVAGTDDAERMREIWTRSIREICAVESGAGKGLIDAWCATKTEEHITGLLRDEKMFWVIASDASGKAVGLGGLHRKGEIMACYVIPEALHRGVGKLILDALEREARKHGLRELRLKSTSVAIPFYEKSGYALSGGTHIFLGGIEAHPMRKALE